MLIEVGVHSMQHALNRDIQCGKKDRIQHKPEIVDDEGSKENKDHFDIK
jgi:hypothetical protein